METAQARLDRIRLNLQHKAIIESDEVTFLFDNYYQLKLNNDTLRKRCDTNLKLYFAEKEALQNVRKDLILQAKAAHDFRERYLKEAQKNFYLYVISGILFLIIIL